MTNGFDISAWQADTNGMPLFDVSRMSRAKEEGNSFVIIKLGEGFQEDEFFTQHMTAALNAGLEVGVYYFSRAYDTQTAEKEAAFVINTLVAHGYTNWHVKAGIWYDYEEHRQLRNNINYGVVTPQTMTNCISVFVNQLWRAGYDFVEYTVGIAYCGTKPTCIASAHPYRSGAHNTTVIAITRM